MAKSTIIECRNRESGLSRQNGDWTTVLKESITINEGDQIRLLDSFIDTQQTETSKILIEKDLDLTFEIGYYNMDYATVTGGRDHYNPIGTTSHHTPCFKPLCLAKKVEVASNPPADNWHLIKDITLQPIGSQEVTEEVELTFTFPVYPYPNPTAIETSKTFTVLVPSLQPGETFKIRDFTGEILKLGSGSFEDVVTVSPKLDSFGLKYQQTKLESIPAGHYVFQPYTAKKTVSIKAGNYDPDRLATVLNDATETNYLPNPTPSGLPVENYSMLQTGKQIQKIFFIETPATKTQDFVVTDMETQTSNDNAFVVAIMDEFPTPSGVADIFFGSSQGFSLEYDSNTTRFTIKAIHTPVYLNNTASILYVVDRTVASSSGIWIKNLTARETDTGKISTFWEDKFNFDSSLFVDFTYRVDTISPSGINAFRPIAEDFSVGKQRTAQIPILDDIVRKDAHTDQASWYGSIQPVVTDPPRIVASSLPTTLGIVSNPIIDTTLSFGYYLIEVDSQFKNKFLTQENNYNGIQQVVNRYFDANSYTTGESGQIIYEHRGEPLLLQSFRCRVLTSEKVVAPNIGDDNTIHIEVVQPLRPLAEN